MNIQTIILVAIALVPLVFFDGVGASPPEDARGSAVSPERVGSGLEVLGEGCAASVCASPTGAPGAAMEPASQSAHWMVFVAATVCPGQPLPRAETADFDRRSAVSQPRTIIF